MDRSVRKLRKRFRKRNPRRLKNYITFFFALGVFFMGIFLIWVASLKIPTLESFDERQVVESTKIYDKTGEVLLYDVNQEIKRTVIPFEEISRNIKNATIAIEDKEFYDHSGVKPRSFLRALFANIVSLDFSQGGSTITQQVVKNSLLSREKTISRKIKEWVLAIKLEKVLTKDEILALYLNEIPYGGTLYGTQEASMAFFGKSASALSISESAYLAALPQAPSFYSPYGKNRTALENRKNLVLYEMFQNKFISEDEYNKAKDSVVEFKPRPEEGIKAPHFVFFVINELEEKYGEKRVASGGLRIITTLDYELQKKGEEIAKKHALSNKETFNAENASFVVIDPKTGGILAMVGSRNYFDSEIDGNFNISTAHRQPGSTFKPFVYAEAFNKGYTPETVLFDVRTQFSTRCSPSNMTSENNCYSPDNYDLKYRGPLTMRNSLAQSVNITSVKTLYLAGIADSIRLAEKMGIAGLGSPGQYGLTLVLGGGEVSLLEMTGAYSVFANEGVRNSLYAISEIKDKTGEPLNQHQLSPKEVLARGIALKISDILSDNDARAPAFGQSSFLSFTTLDVAVKTGTTNDYRDAWILGYTPTVALGAWAGNNNNSPMEKKVAGFIVAPMWREYMDYILSVIPTENFPEPESIFSFSLKPVLRGKWQGGIPTQIDLISKKLATEYTPDETIKEYLSGGVHNILYWVDKGAPQGAYPADPAGDPQFIFWEYGVEKWIQSTGFVPEPLPSLPSDYDDVHTPENMPTIEISADDTVFVSSSRITIIPTIKSKFSPRKVAFFLNGKLLGEPSSFPFSLSFIPKDVGYITGQNELRAVLFDSAYNKAETVVSVFIEG